MIMAGALTYEPRYLHTAALVAGIAYRKEKETNDVIPVDEQRRVSALDIYMYMYRRNEELMTSHTHPTLEEYGRAIKKPPVYALILCEFL